MGAMAMMAVVLVEDKLMVDQAMWRRGGGVPDENIDTTTQSSRSGFTNRPRCHCARTHRYLKAH